MPSNSDKDIDSNKLKWKPVIFIGLGIFFCGYGHYFHFYLEINSPSLVWDNEEHSGICLAA